MLIHNGGCRRGTKTLTECVKCDAFRYSCRADGLAQCITTLESTVSILACLIYCRTDSTRYGISQSYDRTEKIIAYRNHVVYRVIRIRMVKVSVSTHYWLYRVKCHRADGDPATCRVLCCCYAVTITCCTLDYTAPRSAYGIPLAGPRSSDCSG
jgi:hypothetical protein